jgi:hypothetical protein
MAMVRSVLLVLVCSPAVVFAQVSTVTALEKAGAKVVHKDGIISQVTVKADAWTAHDFQTLSTITALKKLTISGKTVDDANIVHIAKLTDLEELSTDATAMSDDGYRHFAGLTKLKSLALFHPSWNLKTFTGTGLSHLKACGNLERLTFAGSTAGDEALKAVGELSQLKHFSTWHTRQTQAGHEHLLKLPKLTSLKMGQRLPDYGKASPPSFDESTLVLFAKIRTLETLQLTEIRLKASSLEPLKALPNLKSLSILNSDLSPADAERAKANFPNVKFDYKPLPPEEQESLLVKKLKI